MVARAQKCGLCAMHTADNRTGSGYGTPTVCPVFFQWGVAGPAVSTEVTDQKEALWIWAEQCVSFRPLCRRGPGSHVSVRVGHVSTWEC